MRRWKGECTRQVGPRKYTIIESIGVPWLCFEGARHPPEGRIFLTTRLNRRSLMCPAAASFEHHSVMMVVEGCTHVCLMCRYRGIDTTIEAIQGCLMFSDVVSL